MLHEKPDADFFCCRLLQTSQNTSHAVSRNSSSRGLTMNGKHDRTRPTKIDEFFISLIGGTGRRCAYFRNCSADKRIHKKYLPSSIMLHNRLKFRPWDCHTTSSIMIDPSLLRSPTNLCLDLFANNFFHFLQFHAALPLPNVCCRFPKKSGKIPFAEARGSRFSFLSRAQFTTAHVV